MTSRDSLRRIAYRARAIPSRYGLRPYSVSILTGAWSGTHTGNGVETRTQIPIVEANGAPPKVRWKTNEEVVVQGIDKGTITVGPITPDFPGGGTTYAMLQPALARGETIHALLSGPDMPQPTKFEITTINADRGLHWSFEAKPVAVA